MENISGFGFEALLVASVTFPTGIVLSQFSDDADAFDTPSMQIGDVAMGLNGDMVRWSKAAVIKGTISVIPGSDDDTNLSLLAENNRVGKGRLPVGDRLTLTLSFPSGIIDTYTNGIITDYQPAFSITSAGRLKTKVYAFAFENKN